MTGPVVLGNNSQGSGAATVSGTNSRWNLSALQTIGGNSVGSMTVSSGGQVVSTDSATLGMNANREGHATITGAGSLWTLSGSITVGGAGSGDVSVLAGGGVSAVSVTLGGAAGSSGMMTVSGAGSKLSTTTGRSECCQPWLGNFECRRWRRGSCRGKFDRDRSGCARRRVRSNSMADRYSSRVRLPTAAASISATACCKS